MSVCVCARLLLNGISAPLNCVSGIVSLSGGALFFNAYIHSALITFTFSLCFVFSALVSSSYYFPAL